MKPILIGGSWRETSASFDSINPSDTSDVINRYALGGASDVADAVDAAVAAGADWAHATPEQRHDVLAAAARELFDRREELGRLLSREEGKVLADGIGEATRAARIVDYFAGEALRNAGEALGSTRPDVHVDVSREAVGVVGVIAPWNFPLAIPAWKIAPALAFGNSVVFKPSEFVPASAWALVDIFHRAGVPHGVLNLIFGPGSVVGAAIVDDARVNALTFTGSETTGRSVGEASARLGRRVQLEMGGKNPLVVLDDADLDRAVSCALDGAFFQSGQRCTASSRLIVTEGIYGRFVEELATRLRGLRVGPALDPESQMGPVISAEACDGIITEIETARRDGASLRFGGEKLRREQEGHYLSPALFTDVEPSMRIAKEEVFGPVAAVFRVRDYEQALALANDTRFGLSAGICTNDLGRAMHFKRHVQAGMVMVNLPTAGVDYHVPFGGQKSSSYGPKEQGSAAREFFTTTKTSYMSI